MKKVRVAFIGAGTTTREHIKAFQGIRNVVLCGICNRTREKAYALAQEYAIEKCCPDIHALYSECLPDLVVVCVYEPAKLEILSQCIPYRVPILAEKPIALNYEQSLKVLNLSEYHQCKVWVGLNRRSYSSTRSALDSLESYAQKDEQRIIEVTDQQDLKIVKALNHSPSVLENWMYANCIHLVDYLTIFARGELEKIVMLNPWRWDVPGFTCAHLLFSTGDIGLYKAYWNGPGPWSCTVATSSLFIELKPLEQIKFQKRGEKIWKSIETPEIDKLFKPGFRYQAEQLVGSFFGKEHNLVDIKTAFRSTYITSKIYQG